ncbi:hypothetical protein HPB49_007317 [Dermacentor silvarum]|uniref:Uncharacterized protein n=1 Tax=Dermacentor silvarum TaxID=543639 RepID=A0ACB8C7W2_DERSI|nr:hypothetical protein HPB49_007317 [Dermacentor silvarum]
MRPQLNPLLFVLQVLSFSACARDETVAGPPLTTLTAAGFNIGFSALNFTEVPPDYPCCGLFSSIAMGPTAATSSTSANALCHASIFPFVIGQGGTVSMRPQLNPLLFVLQVCAVHFDPSCLERTTSYTDWKMGKVVEVPLSVPRPRPGSVPSVFPGCPSYLSKETQSLREAPDIKRYRQDASELAHAIQESVASYDAEEERQRFSTQPDPACLQAASVPDVWTVVHTERCIMFLYFVNKSEPCLKASLTVLTASNLVPAIKEFQSKG